jgi:hypothetical protein
MRLTKNQNFLDRLEGKKKCLLAMEQQEESLNLKLAACSAKYSKNPI